MDPAQTIIKAFTKFFFRDVMYVLGGSTIIISSLYVYGKFSFEKEPSITLYALVLGFAYAIGYAIQDIFTLPNIIRTKANLSPNTFMKRIYNWFEREEIPFPELNNKQYEDAKTWLYEKNEVSRFQDDHERIEALKHVGTTLGPCFTLSGLILLFLPLLKKFVCFDIIVILAALFFGISLIVLGWLKVTQQAQYLLKIEGVKKDTLESDDIPVNDPR